MTRRKNFGGQATPSIIDGEYERCNFMHPQPIDSGSGVFVGVRLFPGDDTPRTFINCNLTNSEVPPGSTVTGCNTAIVQRNQFSRSERVTIDGFEVSIDHHKSIVHGRWTSSGYEYRQTPEEFETD